RPALDGSLDREDELHPDPAGQLVSGGVLRRIEDELGQALAISEVHEDQAAMVAALGRPPHQRDRLPSVPGPEDPARVRPAHAPKRFHHAPLPGWRRARSANHWMFVRPSAVTMATPSYPCFSSAARCAPALRASRSSATR